MRGQERESRVSGAKESKVSGTREWGEREREWNWWGERVEQMGRECRERMSGARENGVSGVMGRESGVS